MWEWTLRVWDNGVRNIKLDWGELIDTGPLSRHASFNVAAWLGRTLRCCLIG